MPTGIYLRKLFTKKHKKNISKGLRGNTHTKGKPWSKTRREAQKYVKHKKRKGRKYTRNGKIYPIDWHLLREKIYERDNWTCQECGIKCHNGIKIQCHHIDYDVKNSDTANLITLCASCHCKTNFLKKDWIAYFKDKLVSVRSLKSVAS